MVTQEQLRERLAKRPFEPFRIALTDGNVLEVTRTAQAVTLRRRIGVVMPDDRFRWIWLEHIDHVDAIDPLVA
jgi:hypothetical protein